MGHSTASGRSPGAEANTREGRPETAARNLSGEQIQRMSRNIDKQGFQKIGPTMWELVPKDNEISTSGARIVGNGQYYVVQTWGTTNIQNDRINNGQDSTMRSEHATLAAAKTAAKEELKGYLSAVRYNPRTGATPQGRGLVTSSRASTLAGNSRRR